MDNGDRLVIDSNYNLVGVKGLINLDSDQLASCIYSMFSLTWGKVADTFYSQYKLLEPYSMTISDNTTTNRSSENNNTSSGTDSGTNTNSDTNENKVSGFNSEEYQPESQNVDTSQGSHSYSRASQWGGTTSSDMTIGRNITRKGNIGSKTNQQLIEEERALYSKTLFDYLRKDLDRVLSIPIYN